MSHEIREQDVRDALDVARRRVDDELSAWSERRSDLGDVTQPVVVFDESAKRSVRYEDAAHGVRVTITVTAIDPDPSKGDGTYLPPEAGVGLEVTGGEREKRLAEPEPVEVERPYEGVPTSNYETHAAVRAEAEDEESDAAEPIEAEDDEK